MFGISPYIVNRILEDYWMKLIEWIINKVIIAYSVTNLYRFNFNGLNFSIFFTLGT